MNGSHEPLSVNRAPKARTVDVGAYMLALLGLAGLVLLGLAAAARSRLQQVIARTSAKDEGTAAIEPVERAIASLKEAERELSSYLSSPSPDSPEYFPHPPDLRAALSYVADAHRQLLHTSLHWGPSLRLLYRKLGSLHARLSRTEGGMSEGYYHLSKMEIQRLSTELRQEVGSLAWIIHKK